MKREQFAVVVVCMGGIVWDGFNAHPLDTLQGQFAAMASAVRKYDPFQLINGGKGIESISEEIRLRIPLHLEFDALNALG